MASGINFIVLSLHVYGRIALAAGCVAGMGADYSRSLAESNGERARAAGFPDS